MPNILKCKICGGDIELNNDKTLGTCMYCGSTMTFPKLASGIRLDAFNRGNHFRRMGEFDNALTIYEQMIAEDNTDAEAHWCAALSRFGIEYVEDPATMEYIPTCHRASYESFLDDVDYKAAVQYSDGITQKQYQKDGKKIDDVQRAILSTSQKESPFDVFICYKESDESGGRTIDSVLAQDIYDHLIEKGYKTFFSKITLEDKVGTEFEPYIFAALNSAKVMIVVGTSRKNLDSVWVKNEWSRYLALMKKDKNKVLLPCYKDMDPYDLPEAIAVLQSYNMSSIGFMQDLVRGIEKIIGPVGFAPATNNIEALLKRGRFALEDKEWDKAKKYYDDVLNNNPENGEAYIGMLLAENNVDSIEKLASCGKNFYESSVFSKAIRYSSDEEANALNQLANTTKEAIEEESKVQKEKKEAKSKKRRKNVTITVLVVTIISLLAGGIYFIVNYKIIQYKKACDMMAEGNYENAISLFERINSYNDSETKIAECEKMKIIEPMINSKVGDVVRFGNYQGRTDWIVMDVSNNEYIILVGAEKIAEMPFNDMDDSSSWSSSTVRQWLNNEYFDESFSDQEKAVMISSHIGIRGDVKWDQNDSVGQDKVVLPEYQICKTINQLGLNEKCDSMWIIDSSSKSPYHDYVLFDTEAYNYVQTQVSSAQCVFPEICIDISSTLE